MVVNIDKNSGYCFGVEFAIQMAEDEMLAGNKVYCLGDIVHNAMEVKRLEALGLTIINKEDLKDLKDCKVLIRAHGEPPQTYKTVLENNIELIDASCAVVLKLQNRVKNAYDKAKKIGGQVVIYGKKGHAEVIGLTGQTENNAIIVMEDDDINEIDFSKPIVLFSQTTKSTKGFYALKHRLEQRLLEHNKDLEDLKTMFDANDSICRQVSNREPQLQKFANAHDLIIFVSGKKSSNGKALYQVCKQENTKSYFIENTDEFDNSWLTDIDSVGICGATSTPMWLMEDVKKYIEESKN